MSLLVLSYSPAIVTVFDFIAQPTGVCESFKRRLRIVLLSQHSEDEDAFSFSSAGGEGLHRFVEVAVRDGELRRCGPSVGRTGTVAVAPAAVVFLVFSLLALLVPRVNPRVLKVRPTIRPVQQPLPY